MYAGVCTCVHTLHVGAREGHTTTLSSIALHHIPLRQDLSLNLKLAILALLAGQPILGNYASPHLVRL